MKDMEITGKESDKAMVCAPILSQEEIGDGIYSLWLEAPFLAEKAGAGQFVSVYMDDGAHLLPRPLSICDADPQKGMIRLVYRVSGEGTLSFSRCQRGEKLCVFGPLGNGFPRETDNSKTVLIAGGGIGIPPMLFLAKSLTCPKRIVLGYRDQLFLKNEFESFGEVYVATDDGSAGVRGTVLTAIRENDIAADVIYACGPKPMLRGLKEYAKEKGMECFLSLEERMACGIGACLACVCDSADVDEETNVHKKRVCRDGPVFNAREVLL